MHCAAVPTDGAGLAIPAQTATSYDRGPLRLDPKARVLTHGGVPVTLGTRAVAVLAVLVGRAPEYVAKSAILEAAWPGLVVRDANLAVQISAIRGALARVAGGHTGKALDAANVRFYHVVRRQRVGSRPSWSELATI